MLRKTSLFAAFICLSISGISAQTSTNNDFVSQAIQQFQRFNKIPVEKLYLQLDKPYYSAGESIWYSAYLTDANTLQLSPYSKFVYVELINKSDSVRFRYKIRKDSLGFAGSIIIPSDMPEGDYHLRAYSWWMQNAGPDYFFQKNIHIGNAIDKSIQSTVKYEQNGAKEITADVRFTSSEKISFNKKNIDYQIFEGNKLLRTRSVSLDAQGHFKVGFDFKPESSAQYRIQVAFNDHTYDYRNTFYLPIENSTFDFQFFPEGGNLINNGLRNIAFKAIGQNGLSVEVNGTVFNQHGDSITSFESMHKGMGSFALFVSDSIPTSYYAKVKVKGSNLSKTFNFPFVLNKGIGLIMSKYKEKLNYEIISPNKQAIPKHLYLLAHNKGQLLLVQAVDSSRLQGSIAATKFPSGIIHFLLLDEQGNALSERLTFVNHPAETHISIEKNKNEYSPRQAVNLIFGLKNPSDSLVAGRFSLSVTDDNAVKLDSLSGNIFSTLLLTSDLKGYIEDPNYYFAHTNSVTEYTLDLVMLTHGWTRFNVPSIVQSKFPVNKYYLEEGQSFSGKITNILGRGVKDAQVIVMGMKKKLFKTVIANEKGEFVADGIAFPDSTIFMVQARSKKGHDTVSLTMDQDQFPFITSMDPFSVGHINSKIDDYMNLMSQKFHYEGGERVYHIKEVTVTASKKEQNDENPMYAGMGNPLRSEDLEKRFSGQSVLDIIRTYAGVSIMGESISIRGSHHNPRVIIDDMPYPDDDVVGLLTSINASEVEYVNLIKGSEAAIFGGAGGSGVILIRFKTGADFAKRSITSPGLAIVRPLGYYIPSQFYSPKYETQEQINNANPDLRTTIYWNPAVLISKYNSGKVSFFTADRPGTYTVTIEGITNSGEPLHLQTKLRVKDK